MPEEHVNHVSKEQVESLRARNLNSWNKSKKKESDNPWQKEVENLKTATNKADADLDEVNSQVKDVLTRITRALQQEKENAEKIPRHLYSIKNLYDILSCHFTLT